MEVASFRALGFWALGSDWIVREFCEKSVELPAYRLKLEANVQAHTIEGFLLS